MRTLQGSSATVSRVVGCTLQQALHDVVCSVVGVVRAGLWSKIGRRPGPRLQTVVAGVVGRRHGDGSQDEDGAHDRKGLRERLVDSGRRYEERRQLRKGEGKEFMCMMYAINDSILLNDTSHLLEFHSFRQYKETFYVTYLISEPCHLLIVFFATRMY